MDEPRRCRIEYVPGIFKHDTSPTGPESNFRAVTLPALGLIDRSYPTDSDFDPSHEKSQWERFVRYATSLNEQSDNVRYKVLFVQRHGEGVHNDVEGKVGRLEWEGHWARLDGDGNLTWADAELTQKGKQEALATRHFWVRESTVNKMPYPQSYWSSPLTRCVQTAQIVFDYASTCAPPERALRIAEGLREIHGVHTCDRRRPRSSLQAAFPFIRFDGEFEESDELWASHKRETLDEATQRLSQWTEQLFKSDGETLVSVTTHSGAIRALHRAVAHPDVWVGRGAVVPIMLKMQINTTR